MFRTALRRFLKITGIILLIVGALYSYYKVREYRARTYIFTLAEELGYTPTDHIADGISYGAFSIPPIVSDGDVYVTFTTTADIEEFTDQVKNLGLSSRQFWDMSPSRLWSQINYHTQHTLTIDGYESFLDWPGEKANVAYRMAVQDSKHWDVVLELYELEQVDGVIEIDGQRLEGNVVRIRVYIGGVPLWVSIIDTILRDSSS